MAYYPVIQKADSSIDVLMYIGMKQDDWIFFDYYKVLADGEEIQVADYALDNVIRDVKGIRYYPNMTLNLFY